MKFAGPPPPCIDPAATYTATFLDDRGRLHRHARHRQRPPNGQQLRRAGSLNRYYDGVPFHRIVPGFVIQAVTATATRGQQRPGLHIDDELPADPSAYVDYALAMANSGPDTNGSQFFVVLPGGGAQLQALYSKFGQVTEGTAVVDAIGGLGTASQEPSKAVVIESVTITETPAG